MIDPSSVDWSTVRRASYRLRQKFRYEYAHPITDLNHRLVVIPPARFGDQRRTYRDLLVELKEIRVHNREDRFGNVVIDVFAPEVPEAIEFVAEASVERWAAEPNIISGGWPAAGYLLEVTPLTGADGRIQSAAAMLAASNPGAGAFREVLTKVSNLIGKRHMLRLASNGAYRRQLQEAWGIEPRHLFAFS